MEIHAQLPPGAFMRSIHNPRVIMINDNVAVLTACGILITSPPIVKERTVTRTKVTRVLQKIEGKWLIIHDHASPFPEE